MTGDMTGQHIGAPVAGPGRAVCSGLNHRGRAAGQI
jgi:hypothetical protein